MSMHLTRRALTGVALACLLAPAAQAQTYPNRPIKLLIGFAAGGPLDTYTRVLAQDLSASLGQPVVVENRPGASGQLATDAVAQAEPDGYTLLSTASTFIVNPILLNKPKPDPLKDFVAVSHTARVAHGARGGSGFDSQLRAGPGEARTQCPCDLCLGRHRRAGALGRRPARPQHQHADDAHPLQGRCAGHRRSDVGAGVLHLLQPCRA